MSNDDLRRELAKALAAGRRETERLKAQGLPDDAIMRIWEARAGLRWDEASQTHLPDPGIASANRT